MMREIVRTSQQRDGRIRVFLVDDDEMARAAWKRILETSGQIRVMRDDSLQSFSKASKKLKNEEFFPEVIVAGFPFVEKGLVRSEELKAQWGYFPKFIIVCENKEQVKKAHKNNADWAASPPINDQDLVTAVRAVSNDAKRLCSEYMEVLTETPVVDACLDNFAKLTKSMLQLLFHSDLVNPEQIGLGNARETRFRGCRLVFRNQARKQQNEEANGLNVRKIDILWEVARQEHGAKYVAFDVYNSVIPETAIQCMSRYLNEMHGFFGIIAGREEVPSVLINQTIALFENEHKLILLLGDEALREMLRCKAAGVNPACILQNLYDSLMARATA